MDLQRLNSSPYGRVPTLYCFLPPQQSKYQDTTPGFTTQESSCGQKQKRILDTPVSPWEISDIYSGIKMNTPEIKFLGVTIFRIALKSQHNLAKFVLKNRQETDLLIPEQGGI